MADFTTPFSDVNPYADKDIDRLRASIEADQLSDIIVSENNEILDGHKRYAILGNKVRYTIKRGLKTEAEKRAVTVQMALEHGNPTEATRRKMREWQKKQACEWNQKKRSNAWSARRLGVSESTVRRWLEDAFTNIHANNSKFDGREADYDIAAIEQALTDGEMTQKEIAEVHNISPSLVTKIKKAMAVKANGENVIEDDSSPPKPKERPATFREKAYKIWWLQKHGSPKRTRSLACSQVGVSVGIWKHISPILNDEDWELFDWLEEGFPPSTANRIRHGTGEEREDAYTKWKASVRKKSLNLESGSSDAASAFDRLAELLMFERQNWEKRKIRWRASTRKRLLTKIAEVQTRATEFNTFWTGVLSDGEDGM